MAICSLLLGFRGYFDTYSFGLNCYISFKGRVWRIQKLCHYQYLLRIIKGTLMHYWWECRLVQPLWKAIWRELKKLKMDLPFDPAISLLGLYLKEPKTLIRKNISTPMFTEVLFTITKVWKQPKWSSVDEWIKQLWDIYILEYYSAIKKMNVLPFVTVWMDLENIMLSEISQSGKDKYHKISLICGI